MRNLLKSIVFIFIFCLLWCVIFRVLWLPKFAISTFYDEPKNSLDVVYIGASNAYVHFNTVLAYHQYGFTTGMLSAGDQPVMMTKYFIEDAEKRQNPKLYIIDLNQYTLEFDRYTEGDIRNSIDLMPFSINRLKAIDDIFKYIDVTDADPESTSKNDKINYYFSFLKYHNSWKTLTKENFTGNTNIYKGFYLTKGTVEQNPQNPPKWTTEREKLSDDAEEIFLDLIHYIKENNINVLFVIPNKPYAEKIHGIPARFNTLIDILNDNNLDVINFNTLDDFKIDYKTDLHNITHINVYGATKYTLYLSKYLKENYQLEDHRKDKKYDSWESEYQRFKKNFKKLTDTEYDDLLKTYKEQYGLQ